MPAALVAGTGVAKVATTEQNTGGFVLPIGVVTLLLGDVEASVRLWEANPAVAKDVMRRFQVVVSDVVAHHGGVRPEEQGEGDSFLAAFARATDAVRAAVDLQLELSPARWPDAPRLRLAAHTGEVELRDERNYIGEAVHRAARLRNTGHGEQTLLSATTMELVRDRLPEGASLIQLGAHRLRDLGRPEHVWQLCHPELEARFPALQSLDLLPHNLPTLLTPFVGRERELGELAALLRSERLLTLVGPGGAGKTRLALQLAADELERVPGGVWFVDLAAVATGDQVIPQVAAALGLTAPDADALFAAIIDRLATPAALVVFDNCEHVIVDSAATASDLLESAPGVRVLATSREPLGVPGEVAWRVPSLSLPSSEERPSIDTVSVSEAAQLFVGAARRARPSFRLDDETADVVGSICTRLDGIPLALELAAALLRFLTVQDVLGGLDDRFRLLGAGPRTVLPRQQTLRASVDWSYQLLTPAERVLLDRLSVFSGPIGLGAVEAVVGFPPLDGSTVVEMLGRLVDKSLVVAEDEGGSTRFRLLDTIRQYAAEQLDAAGATDQVRIRHFEHCRAGGARLSSATSAGDGDQIQRALVELDDLRLEIEAALWWAEATDRLADALDLAAALETFWRRHPVTGRRWLRRLTADGAPGVPRPVFVRTLLAASRCSDFEVGFSRDMALQALEVATEVDDERSLLQAKLQLGAALTRFGEVDGGLRLLHEVIEEGGDYDRVAVTEAQMGLASQAFQSGTAATCKAIMEELLPLLREAIPPAVPEGLAMLAISENMLGNPAGARERLSEALAVAETTGDVPALSSVLARVAALELSIGNVEASRKACEEQLNLADRAGNDELANWHLALCHLADGDLDTAAATAAASREVMIERRQHNVVLQVRLPEVEILRRRGRTAEARALTDELLAETARVRNVVAERNLLMLRARLAFEESEPAVAEDYAQAAARIFEETGVVLGLPDLLEELALLASHAGDVARAGRLYGAAAGIRRTTGLARLPYIPEHGPEAEAFANSCDEALAAIEQGGTMSAADATAYARRGRGERKRPLAGWSALTPTETEVVRLVAQHLTNPEIAERLFMSRNTVRTHLTHIFDKVDVRSRSALAAQAMRRGVV